MENLKTILKVNDDQLHKLHLLYQAGFATKKMQSAISYEDSMNAIMKLAQKGCSYNVIKDIFIKTANLE